MLKVIGSSDVSPFTERATAAAYRDSHGSCSMFMLILPGARCPCPMPMHINMLPSTDSSNKIVDNLFRNALYTLLIWVELN